MRIVVSGCFFSLRGLSSAFCFPAASGCLSKCFQARAILHQPGGIPCIALGKGRKKATAKRKDRVEKQQNSKTAHNRTPKKAADQQAKQAAQQNNNAAGQRSSKKAAAGSYLLHSITRQVDFEPLRYESSGRSHGTQKRAGMHGLPTLSCSCMALCIPCSETALLPGCLCLV